MGLSRAFIYMVECSDGTFYTGWTNDVAARVAAHNAGSGARYTRGRGPVRLVYWEECADKPAAQRREWEIKRLSRDQKRQLVIHCSPTIENAAADSAEGGVAPCTEDPQNQEA